MEILKTGVAYHGNRILRHVQEDMIDIVKHNMNLVVHMFSHNDWDRHIGVMKDIVDISKSLGLEVWIDNWGIGGPPGDKSHFLQYHPESHQVMSDGSVDPVRSCYNSDAFVEFTKNWLDTVKEFGGEQIFWDEPHLLEKEIEGKKVFACCCDTCKKLFEERYNKPMPAEMTPEVKEFRAWSMNNYFKRVTAYAAGISLKNITCVMLHTLDLTMDILNVENIDNFGMDPYWKPGRADNDPYDYVYTNTKKFVDKTKAAGKDSHVWIQGFAVPAGYEHDIFSATDGAYDAGARSIIDWSYRGAESNTYKCDNCEYVWQVMGESMRRIRDRHMDNIRNERLKKYLNN